MIRQPSAPAAVVAPAMVAQVTLSEARRRTAESTTDAAMTVDDGAAPAHPIEKDDGHTEKPQQLLRHGGVGAPHGTSGIMLRRSVEDAASAEGERRSNDRYCSPHTPPSLLTTPESLVPPLPRRGISAVSAHASATLQSPTLFSRRLWTHFVERELHTPHNPSQQQQQQSTEKADVGVPAAPVTRTRSGAKMLRSTSVPLPPPPLGLTPAPARPNPRARVLNADATKSDPHLVKVDGDGPASPSTSSACTPVGATPLQCTAATKAMSVSSSSPSLLVSPIDREVMFPPRSPARHRLARPIASKADAAHEPQPPSASHSPAAVVRDDVAVEEEEEGKDEEEHSPSPRRTSSPSQQGDSVASLLSHYSVPVEARVLAAQLPAQNASSTTWSEEKEDFSSIPPPPAARSCKGTRLSQQVTSRRVSRRPSLSFEYAEEDKTDASPTNSDSFAFHGLSPSSAVPSEVQTSALPAAPLNADPPSRGRPLRMDQRGGPSPTSAPPRQDLESLVPPRGATATLVDRHVSLTGNLQQQQTLRQWRDGSSARRVDSAPFHTARYFRNPPHRTRSAVHSYAGRGTRGDPHLRGCFDESHALPHCNRYPRSLSSHSARYIIPAVGASALTSSPGDVPLQSRLNPIPRSTSSTPCLTGSQLPLTPLQTRTPSCRDGMDGKTAGVEEVALRGARSCSNSIGGFSPVSHTGTPLALPQPYHTQSALPSIHTTPLTAHRSATEHGSAETEETTGVDGPALGGSNGPGPRRRSSGSSSHPRRTSVSFATLDTHPMEEHEGVGGTAHPHRGGSSRRSSLREASVDETEFSVAGVAPPGQPPPPPWTPAEALYWMSGRLTRQEAQEIRTYNRVYYCGPAVPPRTACGVTEVSSAPPQERKEGGVHAVRASQGGEWVQASASNASAHAPATVAAAATDTSTSPALSSPSYLPLTLGMHIGFRYEVAEVLGVGTFSVVARAIDHAAPPLSPERHCALKIIRKEDLYRRAAQEEWNVYAQVGACCDAAVAAEVEGSDTESPYLPQQRRFSATLSRSSSSTCRLTVADQHSLLGAGILTPRTRFDFRGYHVLVFPLLGFNVRDVLELQRECEEAAAVEEDGEQRGQVPQQEHKTSSFVFPPLVTSSVVAQVVYALAFLHRTAHLLHGDLKPENVVFVDRVLRHGVTEGSASLPCNPVPQRLSLRGGPGGGAAPAAEVAAAAASCSPPQLSATGVSFSPSSVLHSRSPVSTISAAPHRVPRPFEAGVDDDDTSVPPQAAEGGEDTFVTSVPSTSACSTPCWLRGCAAEEEKSRGTTAGEKGEHHSADEAFWCAGGEEDGRLPNSVVTTPLSRELHGSLSTAYAPHTPSRRTPGLTASRTGTLSSSHLTRQADVLTLDDSTDGAAMSVTATSQISLPGNSQHSESHLARQSHSNSNSTLSNAIPHVSPQIRMPSSSSEWRSASAGASVCSTSSRVAVIDLGHAKPLAPGQTGVTFPLQSPSYRAPEMALRLPYTTAIDMWSLGCVLYELRTGRVLLPNACDDATMLAAAVESLGMPNTTFLSMVKVCWKAYKQRETRNSSSSSSGSGAAAVVARCSSVALPSTSFSVDLTEQDHEGGASAVLQPSAPPPRSVFVPSEDEEEEAAAAAVERVWRGFIQVLNTTAGQQRARAERRRRLSSPTHLSGSVSAATSPCETHDDGVMEESAGDEAVRSTTWETPAQGALLSSLFPEGQANVDEQIFTLKVAAGSRRPAVSAAPSCSSTSAAPEEEQPHPYAWVDFLLGCLYWDAAERLSPAEAQLHPLIATHFTPVEEADEEQKASTAETGAQLPHCSGVYYLQHHPLTARLFAVSKQPRRQRSGSEDVDKQESDEGLSVLSRRHSSVTIPLLSLAPSAIVPFELPSNKLAAPSARVWEERQQQHQQITALCTTADTSGRATPREQKVPVFCGRSPSVDTAHVYTSAVTTAPFCLERRSNDAQASNGDIDLVSPDGTVEEVEKENEVPGDGSPQLPQQESEVMVLRLD
ncbi:putative Protein kinase [Leptomonas pyrrhocoris]|uniref:Protein kinase domain-containing protein n=1 Tax=Leptomonas pyrrhocoris TaxID=157538 RepID=A0A0N0DSW2_LEPPY|nr:putative Protein kinase [Leptomonas pyrrhocoris]KPA76181.1 putative Protein kinase [Leptomonas pyrrhocoris]|eukprot:XP_015654620.1 putative Protein kinase [Leptomonas pyrrhocoris]